MTAKSEYRSSSRFAALSTGTSVVPHRPNGEQGLFSLKTCLPLDSKRRTCLYSPILLPLHRALVRYILRIAAQRIAGKLE